MALLLKDVSIQRGLSIEISLIAVIDIFTSTEHREGLCRSDHRLPQF